MTKVSLFSNDYSINLSKTLQIKQSNGYTVIDLFAGCGGLALGFEAAGFQTTGYEQDSDCCKTYETNLNSTCHNVFLDENSEFESADIVIGGPPCQPFSVNGHQKGVKDSRDGFPAFINAVKKINPKMWMFENVRGLLYKNKWYLEKVIDDLSSLGYIPSIKMLNASNYGVPQNRERVIVVGSRKSFCFPEPLERKVTAYDALGEFYNYEPENGKYLTSNMDDYIKKYEIASKCINPRDLHKDKPSRTVTCRNLAGATGDMLRLVVPSGRRRRLLIEEATRLQSFPDWFKFFGNETSVYQQIGNAVPPLFAYHIARAMLDSLNQNTSIGSCEYYQKQLSLV